MPLVFVHGVATRPSREYDAMVAQRDQLFRSLTFQDMDLTIFNTMWGSFGVEFGGDLPWIPKSAGNQAFGADGDASNPLGMASFESALPLGKLAGKVLTDSGIGSLCPGAGRPPGYNPRSAKKPGSDLIFTNWKGRPQNACTQQLPRP